MGYYQNFILNHCLIEFQYKVVSGLAHLAPRPRSDYRTFWVTCPTNTKRTENSRALVYLIAHLVHVPYNNQLGFCGVSLLLQHSVSLPILFIRISLLFSQIILNSIYYFDMPFISSGFFGVICTQYTALYHLYLFTFICILIPSL